MLASDIISEVNKQLNDVGQVTWDEAALFDYIDSAQQMIVSIRPDANSQTTVMQMVAGALQSAPANAIRLLDVTRNMGTDGLTAGRQVLACTEEALDLFSFNFSAASQAAVVKNFTYDDRAPRTFYVDPPSDGTGYLEVKISVVPTVITAAGNTLDLRDIYKPHIVQWCMYRAYAIEFDSRTSQNRAAIHESSFYQMMGKKFQRDVLFTPSVETQENVSGG